VGKSGFWAYVLDFLAVSGIICMSFFETDLACLTTSQYVVEWFAMMFAQGLRIAVNMEV
jgi:hypothetical protein